MHRALKMSFFSDRDTELCARWT